MKECPVVDLRRKPRPGGKVRITEKQIALMVESAKSAEHRNYPCLDLIQYARAVAACGKIGVVVDIRSTLSQITVRFGTLNMRLKNDWVEIVE